MPLEAKPLGRDYVAYAYNTEHLIASKLANLFDIVIALTLDTRISGDDALRGHTRSHPEHDG